MTRIKAKELRTGFSKSLCSLPVWGQRARLWGWLPIYSLGGAAADHQGSLANEVPLTHPFGPDTEALGRGHVTVADVWIIKHFKNTDGKSGGKAKRDAEEGVWHTTGEGMDSRSFPPGDDRWYVTGLRSQNETETKKYGWGTRQSPVLTPEEFPLP